MIAPEGRKLDLKLREKYLVIIQGTTFDIYPGEHKSKEWIALDEINKESRKKKKLKEASLRRNQ